MNDVESRICENCKYFNKQGHCPLYSLYHGSSLTVGYEVSCKEFKRKTR